MRFWRCLKCNTEREFKQEVHKNSIMYICPVCIDKLMVIIDEDIK